MQQISVQLLYFLLVICIACIEHNHAATKVLYEFHIREATGERNETGMLKTSSANNNTRSEPELVITGKRTSHVILQSGNDDPNSGNSVYLETAYYTADDSGYHVTYNFSIEPLELDTRLEGKTLKIIVG
ncbi:GH18300 [Drosophila grimshawi]|uniref:GH18300 n=1 Tax=Drosophila grimshawi TaxID=7222 RepID=B4JSD4_DROGR|nr:GH18300 [Drosophila grimshawi]